MQFAERIKEQIRQREQSALQQGLEKGKQRLRSASPEELESWLDRVLDAQRLEEVFGP